MPELCIIAALDEEDGIGKDNQIPWGLISEDMKRFRDLTIPYSVVMGRKTADSIMALGNGDLLKHRHNFVVTGDPNFRHPRANVASSLEDALFKAMQFEENRIAIIGGGQIYAQALEKNLITKLYLTKVRGVYGCDTFFPDYSNFKVLSESAGVSKEYKYQFLELVR